MIEIRNIHANKKHPGVVYAEVWQDGHLNMSATLELCSIRAKELTLAESVDEVYKDLPIQEESDLEKMDEISFNSWFEGNRS